MALRYVPLYDDSNQPLLDETGDPLLVEEDVTVLEGGAGGAKGGSQFDRRLWDIYQEEAALRLKPKPKPPEPAPKPIEEVFQPAPPSGFFDAPIDPAVLIARARAEAEARQAQYAINRRTISELLRKVRR